LSPPHSSHHLLYITHAPSSPSPITATTAVAIHHEGSQTAKPSRVSPDHITRKPRRLLRRRVFPTWFVRTVFFAVDDDDDDDNGHGHGDGNGYHDLDDA
jgi:hypothetical protein